jgi:hypothetical protein
LNSWPDNVSLGKFLLIVDVILYHTDMDLLFPDKWCKTLLALATTTASIEDSVCSSAVPGHSDEKATIITGASRRIFTPL